MTETVTYRSASALHDRTLTLATAGTHPLFFSGSVVAARSTARCLAVLADVAAADFRRSAGSGGLGHDPVVTAGGQRLRFEALSQCCGVHGRLDVLPAALDGELHTRGTTNVDVNPELYTALNRVGEGDPLRLVVGPDHLAVTTLDGQVVEKRVPLPARWLRGLAESAVIGAGLEPRIELTGAAATALLQRLPAHRGQEVRWWVPAGRSARETTAAVPGAVCVAGAHRLALLRPLLPLARSVRLWGPAVTRGAEPVASGWELDLEAVRFCLLLSPGVHRGLSGEGGLLSALDDADALVERLAWGGEGDPVELAADADLTTDERRRALAALAVSGKVGYDWPEATWFHRELPYRPELIAAHNPRLVAARALVANGAGAPPPTACRSAPTWCTAQRAGRPAAPADGGRSTAAAAGRASTCWPQS